MLYFYTIVLLVFISLHSTAANFEDTRCRCICPSPAYFRANSTPGDGDSRRYYTKTNVNALKCNTHNVVKESVMKVVDDNRLDAFLANCNCKFESRNSVLLKDVVLLVIVVMLVLIGYMTYLMALQWDPLFRRSSVANQFIPYRRQEDDLEDNIFANSVATALSPSNQSSTADLTAAISMSTAPVNGSMPAIATQKNFSPFSVRSPIVTQDAGNTLEKLEAEQHNWMSNVEEQRRKVLTNHTVLN